MAKDFDRIDKAIFITILEGKDLRRYGELQAGKEEIIELENVELTENILFDESYVFEKIFILKAGFSNQ